MVELRQPAPLLDVRVDGVGTAAVVAEIDQLRRENRLLRAQLAAQASSLDLAASLHRDLCAPPLPDVTGLTLQVLYRPAEAVGGDAYTVRRLNDRTVAVVLIDATGHGVAAAALAAYAQQSIHRVLREAAGRAESSPARMLRSINHDLITADLPDCQNVAALVAVYSEPSRTLRVARGGAPRPILLTHDGTSVQLGCDGPLLGALEAASYNEVAVTLEPNDCVVLHTDGLYEALSDRQETPYVDLTQSEWMRSLAHRAHGEASDMQRTLPPDPEPRDDVTVVILTADTHATKRTISG
jgi:serine phosphatase RsbU (regulator of sigma subunit)